jgi:uncharacterized protein
MSAAQSKPAEPSMEEILASIRRIISDDQAAKAPEAPPASPQPAAPVVARAPEPAAPVMPAPVQPAPPAAPPRAAPPVEEDDEDIMDLAPKPLLRKEPEPHLIHDDPVDNDLAFEDIKSEAAPVSTRPPVLSSQSEFDAIMAAAEFDAAPLPPPSEAVASAPAERLLSPSTDRVVTTAFSSLASTVLANNARTLENLVEEMMRPMIKTWLDDNLPSIVERLIKAEIERVARGGR